MRYFQSNQPKRGGKRAFCALLSLFFLLPLFLSFLSGCGKAEGGVSYEIAAEFCESDMTVSFDMTVDYYNQTGETLTEVDFNLFANAYREGAAYRPVAAQKIAQTYPNGESYGGAEITAAEVNGAEAQFTLGGDDQTLLRVGVGTLPAGKRCTISLRGKITLANCLHRLGYGDRTVNLGNWFPILCVCEEGKFYECNYESVGDPFFSETADYVLRFTAPKEYVVAASGKKTETLPQGEKTTYVMNIADARDFALVLSKDFSVEKTEIGGCEIFYYHLEDENAAAHLAAAEKSLSLFQEKFGAYPYETLSVVETEFTEGGMEYPALTYISCFLEEEEIPRVIAHENAHQWWYAAVGVNQVERGYLDEGLAEYSSLVFLEENPAYGVTRQDFYNAAEQAYGLYCDVYAQLVKDRNTAMERPLKEFLSAYEYYNLAYNKGILMWENYRVSVGDKKFFAGLSEFYRRNKFQNADTEDLFSALKKHGGGVGLLEGFIRGTAIV